MKAKMYIVTRVGWEYNDEYYYRSESGAGDPVEAFTLEELAHESCKLKHVSLLKEDLARSSSEYIANYISRGGYSTAEFDDEWIEKCGAEYNIEFVPSDYNDEDLYPRTVGEDDVNPSTSDQFYIEFLERSNVVHFEVVEVDWVA